MEKYPTEGKYILKGGVVTPVGDLFEWGAWLESDEGKANRRIEWTVLNGYRVSTVFIGLDQRFDDTQGEPILFETMVFEDRETETEIFGSKMKMHKTIEADGCFDRYPTIEEARTGHARIIEIVKTLPPIE